MAYYRSEPLKGWKPCRKTSIVVIMHYFNREEIGDNRSACGAMTRKDVLEEHQYPENLPECEWCRKLLPHIELTTKK